ncbi:AraC family transcriptional regulator [Streptomyces sp. NPDC047023]|uniref:helix-turn-helix transcriptional regulator n=1 Tax=Streptomyces sp. NPDC047023 TaxID=3155139 RepID=UPI0033F29905
MEKVVFDSTDLRAAEAFLSDAYASVRIESAAPSGRTTVARHIVGRLSVDWLAFAFDFSYNCAPVGRIVLVSVHAGHITLGDDGPCYGPGDTFLLPRFADGLSGRLNSARTTTVLLDPEVISDISGRDAYELWHQSSHQPHSAAANRRMAAAISHVRDLADGALLEHDLVASTAYQHIAALALTCIPRDADGRLTVVSDSRDGHTGTLRRSMRFIDDNAHRDISLTDIAVAVGVTSRSVQYAFARHAGMSPLAYLREVRIAHAHADLAAADPVGGATVHQIAARWGFSNQGRFAAAYKKVYGTSPSATLNRGARLTGGNPFAPHPLSFAARSETSGTNGATAGAAAG